MSEPYRTILMDPPWNERGCGKSKRGAQILGRLEKRYGGDKKRILKKYNPTDTGAYSREVMRAWHQAKKPKE